MYVDLGDGTYAFNLWFHSRTDIYECHSLNLFKLYMEALDKMIHTFDLSTHINMPSVPLFQQIPHIPFEVCPKFVQSNLKKKKRKIFYYNYYPRSGQPCPLPYPEDHKKIIDALSTTFPACAILIPKFDGFKYCANVISCEEVLFTVEKTRYR